jgi:hypothetical protein
MGRDERAVRLAREAAALAAGARIELPGDLALWSLAGGRPADVVAVPAADPARALVTAMEAELTDDERRHGAHYTPADLADRVAALALGGDGGDGRTVVDPTCGAGAVLLAAAERLMTGGASRSQVARDQLFGADLDPLAAAVAEAALALWSGGTVPAPGHVVVADALEQGRAAWPGAPAGGFDVVAGNPPFQSQLATATARTADARAALRGRLGEAVTPYVDTAALFLLVALELVSDRGRVALVQPQSTAAARDAGPVRAALGARARLVELWAAPGQPFAARVHVCVPVLEMGTPDQDTDWAARLATARGVPEVEVPSGPTVASLAAAVAGFRQHYYGLVDHVRDDGDGAWLVTCGLLRVGACDWGRRPVRFARRSWARPVVDIAAVRRSDDRLARWLDQVLRPKVVVASQTRVVEAAADAGGTWVPCTPVVSVVPRDPGDVDRLTAVLCAPPVAAWAARRGSGSGLSPHAIRMSTALALAAPLPTDEAAWHEATAHLADGDLDRYADAATAMYALPPAMSAAVRTWWDASQ